MDNAYNFTNLYFIIFNRFYQRIYFLIYFKLIDSNALICFNKEKGYLILTFLKLYIIYKYLF